MGATGQLGSERAQEMRAHWNNLSQSHGSLGLCCFGVRVTDLGLQNAKQAPPFLLSLFIPEYNTALFHVLFRGSFLLQCSES